MISPRRVFCFYPHGCRADFQEMVNVSAVGRRARLAGSVGPPVERPASKTAGATMPGASGWRKAPRSETCKRQRNVWQAKESDPPPASRRWRRGGPNILQHVRPCRQSARPPAPPARPRGELAAGGGRLGCLAERLNILQNVIAQATPARTCSKMLHRESATCETCCKMFRAPEAPSLNMLTKCCVLDAPNLNILTTCCGTALKLSTCFKMLKTNPNML